MPKKAILRKTALMTAAVMMTSLLLPIMAFALQTGNSTYINNTSSTTNNISVTADGSIHVSADGLVHEKALKEAFAKHAEVILNAAGDSVTISVSALADALRKYDSILTVVTGNGTYSLPLEAIDFKAAADELGVELTDMAITVAISKLSIKEAKPISDAIAEAGGKAISAAVDFTITAEGKRGGKLEIEALNGYVARTLPLVREPAGTATVALYNPGDGTLRFVPALISDGEAEFYRPGNSIYTVVELNKTFNDIPSHWAKKDIELLASKLIVDGVTGTTFEADQSITRAEFIALLVRSLGLDPAGSDSTFDDVNKNDWFSGAVEAAAEAGIVSSDEDLLFRPNAPITREELAAMTVRAFEFADGSIAIGEDNISQALSRWSDADQIAWAQREVALALLTGLMNGTTASTLDPKGQATRAHAVTMVKKLLVQSEFID